MFLVDVKGFSDEQLHDFSQKVLKFYRRPSEKRSVRRDGMSTAQPTYRQLVALVGRLVAAGMQTDKAIGLVSSAYSCDPLSLREWTEHHLGVRG